MVKKIERFEKARLAATTSSHACVHHRNRRPFQSLPKVDRRTRIVHALEVSESRCIRNYETGNQAFSMRLRFLTIRVWDSRAFLLDMNQLFEQFITELLVSGARGRTSVDPQVAVLLGE